MTDQNSKEKKQSRQVAGTSAESSSTDSGENEYLQTLEQVVKDRSAE